MHTCPQCSCLLDLDHPRQAYCPHCDTILEWQDNQGWVPKGEDDDD